MFVDSLDNTAESVAAAKLAPSAVQMGFALTHAGSSVRGRGAEWTCESPPMRNMMAMEKEFIVVEERKLTDLYRLI